MDNEGFFVILFWFARQDAPGTPASSRCNAGDRAWKTREQEKGCRDTFQPNNKRSRSEERVWSWTLLGETTPRCSRPSGPPSRSVRARHCQENGERGWFPFTAVHGEAPSCGWRAHERRDSPSVQ